MALILFVYLSLNFWYESWWVIYAFLLFLLRVHEPYQ